MYLYSCIQKWIQMDTNDINLTGSRVYDGYKNGYKWIQMDTDGYKMDTFAFF